MNTDRSFFNVICAFRSGLGQGTDDVLCDQGEVIDRIASGQFENIIRIFEFNPAEGWAHDVTDEILLAANINRESRGLQAAE